MICKKKANAHKIYKKLKGFVSKKTIKKYIDKNHKIIEKQSKFNSNKLHNLLIILIIFCGSLFFYHLYTLWKKYKNEKENITEINNLDLNIVPPSGIY